MFFIMDKFDVAFEKLGYFLEWIVDSCHPSGIYIYVHSQLHPRPQLFFVAKKLDQLSYRELNKQHPINMQPFQDESNKMTCQITAWNGPFPLPESSINMRLHLSQNLCTSLSRNNVTRLKPCIYFNSYLGCRYAEKCKYSHITDGSIFMQSLSAPEYDTPCKYFDTQTQSGCPDGDLCQFKHSY